MDAAPAKATEPVLPEFDEELSFEDHRIVRATVPAGERPRLDAFLAKASGKSRSRVKKLVEQGCCQVDGSLCPNADMRLRPGQEAAISFPLLQAELQAEEGPLDIVYADEDIAVINKPADLTMHPCPSCPAGTLVNRLLSRFPQLSLQEGPRPGIVHRLDKDTSGLAVIALSERARLRLSQAFAARDVHKTYLAITRGVPPEEGMSDLPLGRHPTIKTRMAVVAENHGGRSALTRWKVLHALPEDKGALVSVRLFTGRTHQIRVHLAQAGHPLWGDSVYGPKAPHDPARRQMLHAWMLEFSHPASEKPMRFVCPPPADFTQTLLALNDGMEKIILTGMPGCGKSAVLERLAAHGLPTWSADAAVAAQYAPGADGWNLMRMRWGNAFLDGSGAVDRARLTAMLSKNPGMRRELEELIHPLVRDDMDAFFQKAASAGASTAVAEVPLWFESGWPRPERCTLAVISCPASVRHARLAQTRGWTEEKTASVDSWQWKAEDKEAAADLLIQNSGTLSELDGEIRRFLQKLDEQNSKRRSALLNHLNELWSA